MNEKLAKQIKDMNINRLVRTKEHQSCQPWKVQENEWKPLWHLQSCHILKEFFWLECLLTEFYKILCKISKCRTLRHKQQFNYGITSRYSTPDYASTVRCFRSVFTNSFDLKWLTVCDPNKLPWNVMNVTWLRHFHLYVWRIYGHLRVASNGWFCLSDSLLQ